MKLLLSCFTLFFLGCYSDSSLSKQSNEDKNELEHAAYEKADELCKFNINKMFIDSVNKNEWIIFYSVFPFTNSKLCWGIVKESANNVVPPPWVSKQVLYYLDTNIVISKTDKIDIENSAIRRKVIGRIIYDTTLTENEMDFQSDPYKLGIYKELEGSSSGSTYTPVR